MAGGKSLSEIQEGAVSTEQGKDLLAELENLTRNQHDLVAAQRGHEANAISWTKMRELLENLKKTKWFAGEVRSLILVQVGGDVREGSANGSVIHERNKNFLTSRRAAFREICRQACRSAFGEQSKTVEWEPAPHSDPPTFTLVWLGKRTAVQRPEKGVLHYYWRSWSRGWGNELIKSVMERADERGYKVVLKTTLPGSNALKAREKWDEFVVEIRKQVGEERNASHTVLFSGARLTDAAGIQQLQEIGVNRIVLSGTLFPLDGVSFVRQNDYLIGRALGEMVLDGAARQNAKTHVILCMGDPADPASLPPVLLREKGFNDVIDDAIRKKATTLKLGDPVKIKITKPDVDYESAAAAVLEEEFPRLEKDSKRMALKVVTLSHSVSIAACKVVDRNRRSQIHVFGSDLTDSLFRYLLDREILSGAVGVDHGEYAKVIIEELFKEDWLPNRFRIVDPHSITRAQAETDKLQSAHDVFVPKYRVPNPFPGKVM